MDQLNSSSFGTMNDMSLQSQGQNSVYSLENMNASAPQYVTPSGQVVPQQNMVQESYVQPQEQNVYAFEEPLEQKRSFFSLFIVVFFVGIAAFSGYLWYVRSNEQGLNERYLRSVDSIEQSIRDLQLKENVSYHVAAGDILTKAEEQRIDWSRIVDLILQYETVNIEFVNFSSNKDQQVFVTGKANSYEHIATLIDSLDGNNRIESPFVGSITKREQRSSRSSSFDQLERNTIGFQLTFIYKEILPSPS